MKKRRSASVLNANLLRCMVNLKSIIKKTGLENGLNREINYDKIQIKKLEEELAELQTKYNKLHRAYIKFMDIYMKHLATKYNKPKEK